MASPARVPKPPRSRVPTRSLRPILASGATRALPIVLATRAATPASVPGHSHHWPALTSAQVSRVLPRRVICPPRYRESRPGEKLGSATAIKGLGPGAWSPPLPAARQRIEHPPPRGWKAAILALPTLLTTLLTGPEESPPPNRGGR